MATKRIKKKPGTKKPDYYNVTITVKTKVKGKTKAGKMKSDAQRKLRGAKVKVTKAR